MRIKQLGFTLIELVIAVVIIAILAVVAIPKYISLSNSAQISATKDVAGSLTSASTMNYGVRSATPGSGQAVTGCADASTLLQGGLPAGYTINATDAGAVTAAQTGTCTLDGPDSTTATFVIIGIA